MLGPTDDFLARLERIQRDVEKLPHRFGVAFIIRFDRESGREIQRNDLPFGVEWTRCEDVLNVKGYFIQSVDGQDFFRFKELSVERADDEEEEYWAFPSVRDLQVVTGSLDVWYYYLPKAKKDEKQAICASMECTVWLFDAVLKTCRFAPEAVQASLAHCCHMGDWAAMLLYLALRDAHPLLRLEGYSLPHPRHEDLQNEPLHSANELVLRFMPRHVDVVTLSSYFLEVLRQIAQGSLELSEFDPVRHGNVPLDDFVLSDAYGQGESEAKPAAGGEAPPASEAPEGKQETPEEPAAAGGDDTPKPSWDRIKGELSFGDETVRTIRRIGIAKNVVLVLDTFHELGWPDRVDSPLSPDSQKHHATIDSLNKGLSRIRFRSDGEGKGFIWETL